MAYPPARFRNARQTRRSVRRSGYCCRTSNRSLGIGPFAGLRHVQIALTLAVIVLVEQVGEFGFHILVVVIPRAGPGCPLAALPFDRIADVGAILPDAERLIEPVLAARRFGLR